jgi:hypothetical protein
MANKTSLARLSNGTIRVRCLKTKEVLLETTDEAEAKDFATYESKARGGDGFTIVGEQIDGALELERELPEAIADGQPFFVARISDDERRRLLALMAVGRSAEAAHLLNSILTRDDHCLYVVLHDHRHGTNSYPVISSTAPDPEKVIEEAFEADEEGESCGLEGPVNLRTLGRLPNYMRNPE